MRLARRSAAAASAAMILSLLGCGASAEGPTPDSAKPTTTATTAESTAPAVETTPTDNVAPEPTGPPALSQNDAPVAGTVTMPLTTSDGFRAGVTMTVYEPRDLATDDPAIPCFGAANDVGPNTVLRAVRVEGEFISEDVNGFTWQSGYNVATRAPGVLWSTSGEDNCYTGIGNQTYAVPFYEVGASATAPSTFAFDAIYSAERSHASPDGDWSEEEWLSLEVEVVSARSDESAVTGTAYVTWGDFQRSAVVKPFGDT